MEHKYSRLKEQLEKMKSKNRVYCGNDNEFNKSLYDKLGTRAECMRAGYGSALFNATDKQIKKAREDKKKILSPKEILEIAEILQIDIRNKERKQIISDILATLDNIKQEDEYLLQLYT